MAYAPPALFVAWRDPDSRRIFPVGRLLRIVTPLAGYEFAYTGGAHVAMQHGFQPFIAFPDLVKVYRSRELLPFFKNRVLSSSRPEYERHVVSLALATESVEPITLLGVSGGRRATDLVEIFPDWVSDGRAGSMRTSFLLRGVQYIPGAEERIRRLHTGDTLISVPDVGNPVNPEAMKVQAEDGSIVGFVPDYLVADMTELRQRNANPEIRVLRVNPPPVPRHHRVLCELLVAESKGVVGFRGETFMPISHTATSVEDKSLASSLATAAAT